MSDFVAGVMADVRAASGFFEKTSFFAQSVKSQCPFKTLVWAPVRTLLALLLDYWRKLQRSNW
jgi:hypothetical protein